MNSRAYALVTGAYWSFTITDGALRMLVLLYFHDLGYNPVSLALLFLLYELFGVFTNLIGGWIGTRHGLRFTLIVGLVLQVVALTLLAAHQPNWTEWAAVAWVMVAQALSGIAKDLIKMSAKSAVKMVAPTGGLFRWVAVLTGSKNALKGVGFFVGAALLGWLGFRSALLVMAATIASVLVLVTVALRSSDQLGPDHLGIDRAGIDQVKQQPAASDMLRKSPAIRRLSLARFFLFGSRDIWFVVALPVFLDEVLFWSFEAIGAFLAFWVIGYGLVQSLAPAILAGFRTSPITAYGLLPPMAAVAVLIALSVWSNELKAVITLIGLVMFGVMFALTSSVHSFLILAYSERQDEVAMDVGFYYSANAAGRLVGTLLSGVLFLIGGFPVALIGTAVFLLAAFVVSIGLPDPVLDREGTDHVAVS